MSSKKVGVIGPLDLPNREARQVYDIPIDGSVEIPGQIAGVAGTLVAMTINLDELERVTLKNRRKHE